MPPGFEQYQPDQPKPREADSHLEFSGHSLTKVFEVLCELNRTNESIKGSSKAYSAPELAGLIVNALRAMDRVDIPREIATTKEWQRLGLQDIRVGKAPDYEQLPEVAALTRSNGLRTAVIQARQNSDRGFQDRTPLNPDVTRMFHEITGGYPA